MTSRLVEFSNDAGPVNPAQPVGPLPCLNCNRLLTERHEGLDIVECECRAVYSGELLRKVDRHQWERIRQERWFRIDVTIFDVFDNA